MPLVMCVGVKRRYVLPRSPVIALTACSDSAPNCRPMMKPSSRTLKMLWTTRVEMLTVGSPRI